MLQILIAEDEKIEREYLRDMLKKTDNAIDEIYLAANGEEAVEIYRRHPCDIILMDINMPKKNGLQALREIRQMEEKERVCFILTSYNYFSYAQEAIHLHVEDFILKPAESSIIRDNISKAIEKLKKHENQYRQTSALVEKINHTRPILENECARLLLSGQDEVMIQNHLKVLNIHFSSGFCILMDKTKLDNVHTGKLKNDIEDLGVSCLSTTMKNDIILFVVSNRELNERDVATIVQLIQPYCQSFGVGSIQKDMEQLYQSYMHAIIDQQKDKSANPQVYEQKDRYDQDMILSELLSYIDNGEEMILKEKIKELTVDCIHKEKEKSGSGNQYLQDILKQLANKLEDQYEINIDLPELAINAKQNMQILEMELFYKINNMLRSAKLMKYQQMDHISKKAIDYIEKNYKKQISLNDIADYLNVSSFYLSRILKKNNDKGFTDILNDLRIKEAKKLIRQNMILKEVAFNVGFRSQSYFAKAFKKAVGISPKEYRNLF